ncbi:hypothetical protein GGH94_000707 [Coemansia aciculifera]|uniref:ERCC4 domain-containing protein n=1 Tax=Coemansia aciculifera TaxID=417176 RepID=A0A9W8IMH7_9FUNG|nr:hypothetical protein GGH94_000707 [Coemansia aciculifera]
MLGYSGTDVIELLSDDSLSDGAADESVLEVVVAPGRNAWPSSTPSVNQASRVFNILTPNTPGTPDLPSPSAILGLPRRRELSSESGGSRQALTPTRTHQRLALVADGDSLSSGVSSNGGRDSLLSRQAALDLPSSPPPIYDDDEPFDVFGSARSFSYSSQTSPPPLAATVDDDLDDGRLLDNIINCQSEFIDGALETGDQVYAGAASEFELGIGLSSLHRRPHANNSVDWRRETVSVDYSDAAATEIIDSSSSDEEFAPEPRQTARAYGISPRLSASSSFRLFSSRSASVEVGRRYRDDVHTISTDPSVTALTSERSGYPIVRALSSSSEVGSVAARKESSAEQRRIEAERKKAERAAEKERKEREKEYQKGISSVNKKQVDQRILARDMTLVIDPGVLLLLKEPKRTVAAPSQSAHEEALPLESSNKEHSIFERLREEEIKYRVEETNTSCGILWEMLVRRKWDSRTNLYVPVACPQTYRVKSAAMVVLSSDRFVELLANNRVETLLEIWRGALATKRLFVTVVGLQKYLRRAAAVETREFARQMRTHLKDSVATTAASGKAKTRKKPLQAELQNQLSEEAVEEAVLRLQMTRPWVTWFTQCADTRELGRLLWQTTMDLALAEFNGDRDTGTDDDELFGEQAEPASSQGDTVGFITKDIASALNAAVIRTGTDLADSWIRALTQIPKVTQPVAQSIAAQYPTPKRLFEAWQQMASEAECEQLLAQLSVASATAAGRRLGSAMSTRIYRVFNEPDAGRPFAEL